MLDEDTQRYLRGVAKRVTAEMPDGNLALEVINAEGMHNDLRAGLWYLLDSATRSALKKASEAATA